jgi:hypothetical protein
MSIYITRGKAKKLHKKQKIRSTVVGTDFFQYDLGRNYSYYLSVSFAQSVPDLSKESSICFVTV